MLLEALPYIRRFAGKTIVITGAASGIGAALARNLHQKGCQLALADWDAEGLSRIGTELNASTFVLDVRKYDQVEAWAMQVENTLGSAELLINNAGVTVLGTFAEHSLQDWERVMDVNFWGVIYGCRAFLPQLKKAREARIVNLSSMFGLVGIPGQTSYCASKYAVRGFSEALQEELRFSTVGVTVVHPGGIRTRIIEQGKLAQTAPQDNTQRRLSDFFTAQTLPPEKAAERIEQTR